MHKKHLNPHGVKIPSNYNFEKSNKSIWLAFMHLSGEEVHKDDLSAITQHFNPNAGQDQQVRHLKRDGFNIGDKPGIHKLDLNTPSAEFLTTSKLKNNLLNAKDFEDIKKSYNYCCATCGAKEGQTSARYGDAIIQLQKGHMDPALPGNDLHNIIPQCQYCNRAYLNDFVFDEKGRVKAIASVRPVRAASKNVQKKVLEWLKNNLKSIMFWI